MYLFGHRGPRLTGHGDRGLLYSRAVQAEGLRGALSMDQSVEVGKQGSLSLC